MNRLADAIKWLAASAAGITALLYAVGFLAVQSQLQMLGIAHLIDIKPVEYLMTGGRIFYLLPAFLAVGSLLWTPVILPVLWIRRRMFTRPRSRLLVALSFATLFLGVWVSLLIPSPGLLLSKDARQLNIATELLYMGEAGRPWSLLIMAALSMEVALLCFFGWQWARQRRQIKPVSKFMLVEEVGLGLILCIQLALLPSAFGTFVMPLRFPHIIVEPGKDAKFDKVEGWLMNESLKPDDAVIVFRKGQAGSEVVIIPKSSFDSIHYIDDTYIFPIR